MDNPPFQRADLQRYWRPGFKPGNADDDVVSELLPEVRTSPPSISLTTPEWQFIRNSQGKEELYHWLSDPGESSNLAQSPENQKVLKDLQIQLSTMISESLRPWKGPDYLFALSGSDRTLATAGRSSPELEMNSAHPAPFPIGTAQAFFPRRASVLALRPSPMDQELLQTLPYH